MRFNKIKLNKQLFVGMGIAFALCVIPFVSGYAQKAINFVKSKIDGLVKKN